MKMRITAVLSVMALIVGVAAAEATTLTATNSDPYYVGNINDGVPSDPSDEVGYINTLIAQAAGSGPTLIGTETYTRSTNVGPYPAATLCGQAGDCKHDLVGEPPPASSYTGINVVGFSYILAKYDGHNEGAGAYVWYIAGLTSVDLPGVLPGPNKYDISHYTLFGPTTSVPDGGTAAGLLGLAIIGMGYLRRRLA